MTPEDGDSMRGPGGADENASGMAARAIRWKTCAAIATAALAAAYASVGARASEPPVAPAFARLAAMVDGSRGYAMRVDSHEERDDRSEELTYTYDRPPEHEPSRIVIEEGRGAGVRIDDLGGDRVAVRSANRRFIVIRPSDDPQLLTLRGASVRAAGLEAFVACARAHPAALSQRDGPMIAGVATVALVFDRRNVSPCPNDSPLDRALTYDVLYLSRASGVPVLRKRYAGLEVVVRWRIRDFVSGSSVSR